MNVPITKNVNCNVVKVVPTKNKIQINYDNVMKCENEMWGLKNDYKNYNNIKIYKREQIIKLNNDECLFNLLRNKPANCKTNNIKQNNEKEIQSGLLILNPINGMVIIDNSPISLIVIKFENATVVVGNRTYQQEERTIIKPLPIMLKSDLSTYGKK